MSAPGLERLAGRLERYVHHLAWSKINRSCRPQLDSSGKVNLHPDVLEGVVGDVLYGARKGVAV